MSTDTPDHINSIETIEKLVMILKDEIQQRNVEA